jgi:mannose-1-phosphate guanylyltransferase
LLPHWPIASALILAGGSGTRFWPASRRRQQKQLAPKGAHAQATETGWRRDSLHGLDLDTASSGRDPPAAFQLAPQRILAEPVARHGAGIAWALEKMPPEAHRRAVMMLPSDHDNERKPSAAVSSWRCAARWAATAW